MSESVASEREELMTASRYEALLRPLSAFPTIIVTGPHRSGTTFATEALGHDLGYMVVREEHFGFKGFRKLLWIIFWTRVARLRIVVQAPAVFHRVPIIARIPATAIVVMRRPLNEIARSWTHTYGEGGKLLDADENNTRELNDLGYASGNAAEIKYDLWERWKVRLPNTYDLEYHSLRNHSMYVSDEARRERGASWTNRRTH